MPGIKPLTKYLVGILCIATLFSNITLCAQSNGALKNKKVLFLLYNQFYSKKTKNIF